MADSEGNKNALVEAKAELKSEGHYQKEYGDGSGVAEAKSEAMSFNDWDNK